MALILIVVPWFVVFILSFGVVVVEIPLLVECKANNVTIIVEVSIECIVSHFFVKIIFDRQFFSLIIFYIKPVVSISFIV